MIGRRWRILRVNPPDGGIKVITIKTTEAIFEHFEKFIRLSEDLRSELKKRLKQKSFKKKELVLDASRVSKESYFITTGILRTYFLKDGKEISEYFCGANEWVNSPKSFTMSLIQISDPRSFLTTP